MVRHNGCVGRAGCPRSLDTPSLMRVWHRDADTPASRFFEVDSITTGPIPSPFTLVVLRPLGPGESKVVATSRDAKKMERLRLEIEQDLAEMTCAAFVRKYSLQAPQSPSDRTLADESPAA